LTDIKIRNNIRLIETTIEVENMSIQGIGKSNAWDITQLQESQNIKKANTDFKYMQDIIQSRNGQKDNIVISEEGKNILDVYKEALKTSNAVPAAYKGDAYSNFADNITELLSKDYINIPDLILSIGYSNGMLQSLTNESVMQARFNVVA
jgi:23S rRNA pseudoU1915 N3-methylase RlmH